MHYVMQYVMHYVMHYLMRLPLGHDAEPILKVARVEPLADEGVDVAAVGLL